MSDLHSKLLLIIDDREFTCGSVKTLVGYRRFGEIIFKRQTLIEHFRSALPSWAHECLVLLKSDNDISALNEIIGRKKEGLSICVIAGRSGFIDQGSLGQLIERLPYAEEDFTDGLYRPLIVFFKTADRLIKKWPDFLGRPLHLWEQAWSDFQRIQSVQPLDLAKIGNFLSFTSGSTAPRHFNEIQINSYYYTKRSIDKKKMMAEYSFYGLAPESMRPWLIQPFGFKDEGERASYKMLRYYMADAALQWVHGAFDIESFLPFVERLLFFLSERSRRNCSLEKSEKISQELFVNKLTVRIKQFLTDEEGQRINKLAASAAEELDVHNLFERYMVQYNRFKRGFISEYQVVGHGDPCSSNLLYDQTSFNLKLIDPKGALTEDEIWTHPLYDLCKISHSIMGDYDFINNGQYSMILTDRNNMILNFPHTNHDVLKSIFLRAVKERGHDSRIMRLAEASPFISMLPLHLDHPNKIIAFMLKAREIINEVENG